jgi:hypothetical protein
MRAIILVCLVAYVTAQGAIPSNLVGTYKGTLKFNNQLLKGADNSTGTPAYDRPIFFGCCGEIYEEPVDLVVTASTANFTSPGASGQCGPSAAGFILFTGVTRIGATECYQGQINLNNIIQNVPGKFQMKADFSFKTDIFAALSDFANTGKGLPALNNCPYDSWTGDKTLAGLPCVTAPSPIPGGWPTAPIPGAPAGTTGGLAANVLASQALGGKFTLNAAGATAPSMVVALVIALFYAVKQL